MAVIVRENRVAFALIAVTLVCFATRVLTGLHVWWTSGRVEGARRVRAVPYWVPWLGHALPFGLQFQKYMAKLSKVSKDGVYSLHVGGKTINVVTAPSLSKQLLFTGGVPKSMHDTIHSFVDRVWDARSTIRDMNPDVLWSHVHKVLNTMMREPFLSTAIAVTIKNVELRAWNLIGGNASWIDQTVWERSGRVEMIELPPSPGQTTPRVVAEASLHPLLRDFVGDIATLTLMGRDFTEKNPSILSDLWALDGKVTLFMLGLPSWLPGMATAARARARILIAVQDHHDALMKYLDGADPGSEWADMSDVSSVMVERTKAWQAASAPARAYAAGDGIVLWAMNVNANQVIFWTVWYIFACPGMLQEIRTEIAPYLRLVAGEKTGLPIREPPRLSINLNGLMNNCPLLKGAFYETMRLEAASTSFQTITDDYIITESAEDARLQGKDQPESFRLKKGELLCVPHGVHQGDERHWKDADQFNPRRFWTKAPASVSTDKANDTDAKVSSSEDERVKVEYGTMKVWGGGKTKCKGQNFAEREVMLFVASIVSTWEMEPVDAQRVDGKAIWQHPGRLIGAATAVPKKDVRVRMWRREAW